MSIILCTSPVVFTILALWFGARSLHAALLGVMAAIAAITVGFPIPVEVMLPTLVRWLPILIEILLIVGGGLLLSEILREAGAQIAIADWIRGRTGHGVGAVLLVVHGITPFAESLTGFGIGVTIGIPLLAHFGLPARKVAVIGLLGLCAVPWGSMGPGTLIAATMTDVPFKTLGIASAVVSLIPFTVTGVAAAWLASPAEHRIMAVFQGLLSGIVLTLAVTAMNWAFSTPPAGALGSLLVIALHLFRGGMRQGMVRLNEIGRRALMSYSLLLGGVLAAEWLVSVIGLAGEWRYLASPALWLFVAAGWFASRELNPKPIRRAWRTWLRVAPVTGLFILLGVLMAASGMATFLAETLAGTGQVYVAAAPFVGAIGGFVTGSSSGANAMFAATQGAIARSLHANVLWFIAVNNVSAAFLMMSSPGKIEMALQLASADASGHRRWVQIMVLGVGTSVVCILAVLNVLIAFC